MTMLQFTVDRTHIAVALRSGGRITPVSLALLEQTAYRRAEVALPNLVLSGPNGRRVACPLPAELADYLARYAGGEKLEPATFTLDVPDDAPSAAA